MVAFQPMLAAGLLGAAAVAASAAQPSGDNLPGCGEVNVFYTGLPAYHRFVIEQGWDPSVVDRDIRQSQIDMMRAGYNVKIVLSGPENPMQNMVDSLGDIAWDVTGIGYGQRGALIPEVIERFEDNIMMFKKYAYEAPTVFNYNPSSFLWSVRRRAPLASDCADKPGFNLGYEEYCEDECSARNSSVKIRTRSTPVNVVGAMAEPDSLFGQ